MRALEHVTATAIIERRERAVARVSRVGVERVTRGIHPAAMGQRVAVALAGNDLLREQLGDGVIRVGDAGVPR